MSFFNLFGPSETLSTTEDTIKKLQESAKVIGEKLAEIKTGLSTAEGELSAAKKSCEKPAATPVKKEGDAVIATGVEKPLGGGKRSKQKFSKKRKGGKKRVQTNKKR